MKDNSFLDNSIEKLKNDLDIEYTRCSNNSEKKYKKYSKNNSDYSSTLASNNITNSNNNSSYHKSENNRDKDNNNNCNNSTCSTIITTDYQSSSIHKQNLDSSIELERRIEEIMNKNSKKDHVTIKIKADLSLYKQQIFTTLTIVLFTLLHKFKPFNIKLHQYMPILYILPLMFIYAVFEFKNSYLKYANKLANVLVMILGFYSFLCILGFIILLNLKSYELEFLNQVSTLIYFISIFMLLFVLSIFWCFLYHGYNRLEEKKTYFHVLSILLFFSVFSVLIYTKISFEVKCYNWTILAGLFAITHLINFIYFSELISNKPKSDFNNKQTDSVVIVFDILINLSCMFFYFLYARLLDGELIDPKENAIYLLLWMCMIISLFKCFYKIGKISSYFEWKKMVIM